MFFNASSIKEKSPEKNTLGRQIDSTFKIWLIYTKYAYFFATIKHDCSDEYAHIWTFISQSKISKIVDRPDNLSGQVNLGYYITCLLFGEITGK